MKKELYNVKAIVQSIKNVLNFGDINKLSKTAYKWLTLYNYDISHYSHHGFMLVYENDILEFSNMIINGSDFPKRYERDSQFIEWYGEEYCKSVSEIARQIEQIALGNHASVKMIHDSDVQSRELGQAIVLAEKHGYKLERK